MGKWWPLGAALVYAALVAGALFVFPSPPGVTAAPEDIVRFYAANGESARITAWLGALSALPLIVLTAKLRSRLTGIERDVLLLGGAAFVVETLVFSWQRAGLALHPAGLTPQVAQGISDVGAFFAPSLTVAIAAMAAAVAVSAGKASSTLPRWLAWASWLVALEQVVESITMLGTDGFTAPGGDMNFNVGAPLTLLWLVAAGAALGVGERKPKA